MDLLPQIIAFLKKSRSILFVTGAGISADSGLPTYRGIGGLYNEGTTEEGIPIEMALAGDMLASRPEVTWKYLAQIESKCRGAKPNRAHQVIAEMEKHFDRVWVLTQNIDGFHRAAGSSNVIDIHGNFHDILCPACGWRTTVTDYSSLSIPPKCPRCARVARPDVVFFGEMLAEEKLKTLYRELRQGFDITFSVGTTSVFPYIQQPVLLARQAGKPTVEINPSETEISGIADIRLRLGAADALGKIWKAYVGQN